MKNKTIFLLFALFMTSVFFGQSPWLQGKNEAFVQLGFSGIFYDEVKYEGDNVSGFADFRDITIQVYSEYGITDKLDALVILPYKSVGYETKATGNQENLDGLGNVTLGLKYLICDSKWKLSAGLNFTGNSGTSDFEKGLRTGFQSNTYLPYLSVGSSYGKWYYFANLGYGFISNNYSDFLKVGGEVGYRFLKNTHIIAVTDLRNNVDNGKFSNNLNYQDTGFYLDGQQYLAAGLKLNHEFIADKIGANLSAIGAFNLNNIPNAPSVNIGIYTKF
ncbi:MAG: hypothetical protein ACI9XR_002322 [Flavobacterium sp.]|jgi:hypothetical protein